jgi:hypothetical protein
LQYILLCWIATYFVVLNCTIFWFAEFYLAKSLCTCQSPILNLLFFLLNTRHVAGLQHSVPITICPVLKEYKTVRACWCAIQCTVCYSSHCCHKNKCIVWTYWPLNSLFENLLNLLYNSVWNLGFQHSDMIHHSTSRTVHRCWRTLPEDACSYWKLAARVDANECYCCAEGNVCCIYVFVCLIVPVYAAVLRFRLFLYLSWQ